MSIILNSPANSVAFNIINFPIYYYGLIMSFSIIVGIFLCYFIFLKKYSKNIADCFLDFIPMTVIFSIFGARLFYIIGNLNFYINHPKEIFLINHGGLSIFGGIIFGTIFFLLYSKKHKLKTYKFLDVIALVMPLCQAIGRWGNYFNQEAYGLPTNGFIKLFIDLRHRSEDYLEYQYFHPTFLYESILNLILFTVLMFLFFKNKSLKTGNIFYLYLIFYSIIRIFVERLRVDSVLNFAEIPVASILSFLVLVISVVLLLKNNNKI